MVKEVASKTGDDAGDGTTTATILAQSIINVGLKNVTAGANPDRKSTRLNSSHVSISYAVFCLKKKKKKHTIKVDKKREIQEKQ